MEAAGVAGLHDGLRTALGHLAGVDEHWDVLRRVDDLMKVMAAVAAAGEGGREARRRRRLRGGLRGSLPGQGSAAFCGADHRL